MTARNPLLLAAALFVACGMSVAYAVHTVKDKRAARVAAEQAVHKAQLYRLRARAEYEAGQRPRLLNVIWPRVITMPPAYSWEVGDPNRWTVYPGEDGNETWELAPWAFDFSAVSELGKPVEVFFHPTQGAEVEVHRNEVGEIDRVEIPGPPQ